MKSFALLAFISFTAQAMPELYCVSTSNYAGLTQIEVFTNAKGTLRVQAELTSQEGYRADLGTLVTLQRLTFNATTGTISNNAGTVEFKVSDKTITPKKAYSMFATYTDEEGTYSVGSGFKRNFSKFHLATMKKFKVPAKKDSWAEALNEAFTSGTTSYVCGDVKDMIND